MSDRDKAGSGLAPGPEEPAKGISLPLVYSLIALALFTAIGIAVFIVLPFYHRR